MTHYELLRAQAEALSSFTDTDILEPVSQIISAKAQCDDNYQIKMGKALYTCKAICKSHGLSYDDFVIWAAFHTGLGKNTIRKFMTAYLRSECS